MSAEGKIKLAEVPPTYCSSCFGQMPQDRHVDFGAYWDGPVIEPKNTENGVQQVQIDDLVICETCIIRAAGILGLVNAPDLVEQVRHLKARVQHLEQGNADLARAGRRLVEVADLGLSRQRASRERFEDAMRARRKAEKELEAGVDEEAQRAELALAE